MLQNFWTCNIAIFIDMSYYKYGDPLGLAQLHQGHSAVFYLGNTSWGGFVFLIIESLNRINDQNIRFQLADCFHNVRELCFGKNIQRVRNDTKPVCPKLELPLAFLSGDIQDLSAHAQTCADLQEQS